MATNPVWRAQLSGDEFDLETLANHFNAGDPTVQKVGDVFLLGSALFYSISEPDEVTKAVAVRDAAVELLELINGAAKIDSLSYRPVGLSGRIHREVDGDTNIHILASAEMRMRFQLTAVATGGTVLAIPPQAPAQQWVSTAASDGDVDEVLRLFGAQATIGWGALFKVLEIIEHNVGGRPVVVSHQWATSRRLSIFTGSADHPALSGREARHARLAGSTPTRSMTLDEGRALMQALFQQWFDWIKAGRAPAPLS